LSGKLWKYFFIDLRSQKLTKRQWLKEFNKEKDFASRWVIKWEESLVLNKSMRTRHLRKNKLSKRREKKDRKKRHKKEKKHCLNSWLNALKYHQKNDFISLLFSLTLRLSGK
jgi:hypothetical protein